MGPPNNWSKADVDFNLFERYSQHITQFTQFDRESIMLYPVPNQFTIGDFEVGWNTRLSATDKQFIGTIYPLQEKSIVELTVDERTHRRPEMASDPPDRRHHVGWAVRSPRRGSGGRSAGPE